MQIITQSLQSYPAVPANKLIKRAATARGIALIRSLSVLALRLALAGIISAAFCMLGPTTTMTLDCCILHHPKHASERCDSQSDSFMSESDGGGRREESAHTWPTF